MTVYWVDPYIDTTKGGIHGTSSTTTRTGSYARPWGIAEMFQTAYVSSINGTTLVSGDEIRLKGQALVDFYHNIGTTGNTIDIISAVSGNFNYHSMNDYFASTYRTDLAAASVGTVASFILHDPALLGTHNIIVGNTYAGTSNYTNKLGFGTDNPMQGFAYSKAGITTSQGLKFAFLDPDYTFDYTAKFLGTTYPTYAFDFDVNGITFTDGWTSETVRDGYTILSTVISHSMSLINYWNYNVSSPANRVFDLPNTFINWYHPTANTIPSLKVHQSYNYMTELAYLKLGQWGTNSANAWTNTSIQASTASTVANTSDPTVDIGVMLIGKYAMWGGAGPNTQSLWPIIRTSNLIALMGPYLSGNKAKYEVGNLIMKDGYSGTLFFTTQSLMEVEFLANAHVYAYSNGTKLVNIMPTVLTLPSTLTNTQDSPTAWPGTIYSSGGPVDTGAAIDPSDYFVDNVTANRPNITFSTWLDMVTLNLIKNSRVLPDSGYGHWNNSLGILDCGTTDYKTTNAKISLKNPAQSSSVKFSYPSLHFAGNTYDGKPLALWSKITPTTTPFPALLSYNNAAGDIVVMMSNYAVNLTNYGKSFVFQLPTFTSSNSITLAITIERSSSSMTQLPKVVAFPIKPDTAGTTSKIIVNSSLTGNVYSYTATMTGLDPQARFIGLAIEVSTNSNLTVADTYTITDPTFTVT